MESKNVVLVHGAWADGSSWGKVISLLDPKQFNVTAVQLPLTSFDDDIDVTRNALAAQADIIGAAVETAVPVETAV